MIPKHWHRSDKRSPRVAYERTDGAAILQDGQRWSIRESIGSKPLCARRSLAEAIAWADENIEYRETA